MKKQVSKLKTKGNLNYMSFDMSYTASKPKIKNTHNADLVNHFYACARVERMQITLSSKVSQKTLFYSRGISRTRDNKKMFRTSNVKPKKYIQSYSPPASTNIIFIITLYKIQVRLSFRQCQPYNKPCKY